MKIIHLVKNEFRDSLFLLKMSNDVSAWEGVKQAVVVMGTENNKRILEQVGLYVGDAVNATADDLVIAVEVESADDEARILEDLQQRLKMVTSEKLAGKTFYTLGSALAALPESNIVSISVPGKFAADMIKGALEADKHVFCFSQHVSVDDELELKRRACEKGLLLMGPDCGTAIVDGYGLGFANKVRSGSIGLVSASGSGLQEVVTLIHKAGGGISQAIGVGGRDMEGPVDGLMAEAAVRLLGDDERTEILVVLAKKASPGAQERVLAAAKNVGLPLVADFGLGCRPAKGDSGQTIIVTNFEECAREAIKLAGLEWLVPSTRREFTSWWDGHRGGFRERFGDHWTLRGLYAGGSLCGEAVSLFQQSGIELSSNLGSPLEAYGEGENAFLDLGAEEYTEGRPHPFIDYRIRVSKIKEAFSIPSVGLLLMDVVLGWGSTGDPAGELVKGIRSARQEFGKGPLIIASVCGTPEDFQNADEQITKLVAEGIFVAESNAAAAGYALEIMKRQEG